MKRMLAVALFATAVSCMAQQPQIRIDVNGLAGKIALAPVKSEQGFVVDNPGWMKENKECYLTVFGGKVDRNWTACEFSFTPDKDGKVILNLMGPWFKEKDAKENSPVWVAYDNLTVTGAEIKNTDFENIDNDGKFGDWNSNPENVLKDQSDAQSGKNYVKVWHNKRIWQTLEVKKGQTVTIKFFIKAVEDKK